MGKIAKRLNPHQRAVLESIFVRPAWVKRYGGRDSGLVSMGLARWTGPSDDWMRLEITTLGRKAFRKHL